MIEYSASKISENMPSANDWDNARSITLVNSQDGGSIAEPCEARILWNELSLFIKFECIDKHIWGTYKNDDDPIYSEEVVEIFMNYGADVPKEYFELQFSPNSVKYDAWVKNPTGDRTDDEFEVDTNFDFKNMKYKVEVKGEGEPKNGIWKVFVKIPADEIKGSSFAKGDILRGNLFRIDGWPAQNSFQSWVFTMKKPADFHVPQVFGKILLV